MLARGRDVGGVNIKEKVGWTIHSLRVMSTDISEGEETYNIYQNFNSTDT